MTLVLDYDDNTTAPQCTRMGVIGHRGNLNPFWVQRPTHGALERAENKHALRSHAKVGWVCFKSWFDDQSTLFCAQLFPATSGGRSCCTACSESANGFHLLVAPFCKLLPPSPPTQTENWGLKHVKIHVTLYFCGDSTFCCICSVTFLTCLGIYSL